MIATPVSREALLHVVKNLPAAPRILAQLGGLLLDPNSDLSDVIELLKHDSGLTARAIRIANSAVYGSGSRAGSLDEALMRVGFNEVYRLVGLAAVAQISDDTLFHYGVTGVRFRENSLFAAFVMEALAPNLDLDARSAYTAGLLRSTGKIALDRLAPAPAMTRGYAVTGRDRPIADWEMELVGMDNCMAAATVLGEWRFPLPTIGAIRDQYRPGSSSPVLAHLLNIACGAAEQANYPLPGESTYWELTPVKLEVTRLEPFDIERAIVTARGEFERVREAIS
jgi:HD-like signal output (HDOD) protein